MTSQMSEVLARLHGVKATAKGFRARCPAHDDKVASLSVDPGSDGRVLLFCHAGCTAEAIVAAIGKTLADLMPPREVSSRPARPARRVPPVTDVDLAFMEKADAELLPGRRVEKQGTCPRCQGPLQMIVLSEPHEPDGPVAVGYCLAGCPVADLVVALSRRLPGVEFNELGLDTEDSQEPA